MATTVVDIDRILQTIKNRESSGGNYTAQNKDSSASGAYQYMDGTWVGWLKRVAPELVAQYPKAKMAPPELQDRVARFNVQSILDSAGGRLDAVPRAWYTGNPGAPDDMQPPGKGNEGHTVGRYVSGWMSDYNGGGVSDPFSGDSTPISDGSGAPGTGTANEVPKLSPDATPEQIRDYVRENYGYMVAYLEHVELGPIIIEAAQHGWGPDKIVNKMMATQWWRDTTASVRTWEREIFSDPATAQAKRDARFKVVQDMVRSFGIALSDAQVEKISEDSLKFAWDTGTINDVILAQRDKTNANVGPGTLSATADAVRAAYRQQLMPITDTGATSIAARILKGETTLDGVRSGLQTQTQARFSQNAGLTSWLQGGNNAADYFATSKATVAQELEVDEAEIDLMAKEWGWIIEVPDGKGGHRQPTTAEVQKRARQDSRAVQTNGFRESMGGIATQLSRAFGF